MLVANPFFTWTGILPFKLIYTTALNAIAERQRNPDARFDILTHWLKAYQDGKVTMRDIQAQATLGVLGGTDAMSTGLQTFVYHLIRHPTAWERCRAEIAEAREQGKCTDSVVSLRPCSRASLSASLHQESLRLFGPSALDFRVSPLREAQNLAIEYFLRGTILTIHP